MTDTATLVADWLIGKPSRLTRGAYRRAVTQFADWLGADDLTTATRKDIRHWIAHLLAEELTDSSVRAKVSAVSSFYAHLVAEGTITTNPAADVERPRGESAPRLGLTVSEAHRLEAACADHSQLAYALFWLMAGVALRVTEACTVLVEDYHDTKMEVRVKGGHRQIKPVSPVVAEAIAPVIGDRTTGPILTHTDGRPVKAWQAQPLIAELATKAGVTTRVTPHILRHTAATLALEAGANVEDVSALLGHRSLETTQRYIHNRDVLGGAQKAAALLAHAIKERITDEATLYP